MISPACLTPLICCRTTQLLVFPIRLSGWEPHSAVTQFPCLGRVRPGPRAGKAFRLRTRITQTGTPLSSLVRLGHCPGSAREPSSCVAGTAAWALQAGTWSAKIPVLSPSQSDSQFSSPLGPPAIPADQSGGWVPMLGSFPTERTMGSGETSCGVLHWPGGGAAPLV